MMFDDKPTLPSPDLAGRANYVACGTIIVGDLAESMLSYLHSFLAG